MCFLKNLAPRRFDEQPRTQHDRENSLAFINTNWGLKDQSPNYNEMALNPFALDLASEAVRSAGRQAPEATSLSFNHDDIYKTAASSTASYKDNFEEYFMPRASSLAQAQDSFKFKSPSAAERGLVATSFEQTARREFSESNGPQEKIKWSKDATSAYTESVERNEPLVMIFQESGQWTDKLNQQFESPQVQQYANEAVFVKAVPSQDTVARNIATALGVERLPTISVLNPDPNIISERGRIEGFEDSATLSKDLDRFIRNYTPPKRVDLQEV